MLFIPKHMHTDEYHTSQILDERKLPEIMS